MLGKEKIPNPYKAIIFDMDGVLVYTEPLYNRQIYNFYK